MRATGDGTSAFSLVRRDYQNFGKDLSSRNAQY